MDLHKRTLQDALDQQRAADAAQAKRQLAASMQDLKTIDRLLQTA